MDAVTSLAILDDYSLVSGSRDKSLRCWQDYKSLSTEKPSLNSELIPSAHNDWINTLETDVDHRELYSGSKDGIVKVWKTKRKQMRCVASLSTSSTASINSICRLDK